MSSGICLPKSERAYAARMPPLPPGQNSESILWRRSFQSVLSAHPKGLQAIRLYFGIACVAVHGIPDCLKYGSVFFQKKAGTKKTGEISRNLPFFRRLACQTAVFLVRINFERTTWQGQEDSNPRPTVLETGTLPAELYPCATPVL